jgi:hypothetical protein
LDIGIKKKTKGGNDRGGGGFSAFLGAPNTSQAFFEVFDMDSPKKVFGGVFELPLLRNAQKRHKIPTPFSGYLVDIRRFQKKS